MYRHRKMHAFEVPVEVPVPAEWQECHNLYPAYQIDNDSHFMTAVDINIGDKFFSFVGFETPV